ncbi:MAG: hypothetical protein BWY59_00650 [Verrucomicrobia bacterium ADurb.Bin345]|nr:MAG: hypothetical protein BWY59_00650 [Verrucomicrobia bacterium ADurb.Bin345]
MRLLDVVRGGDGNHLVAARIHVAHEALDVAALARGVPPFVEDHEGNPFGVDPVFHLPHALLQPVYPLLVFGARQRLRQVHSIKDRFDRHFDGRLWRPGCRFFPLGCGKPGFDGADDRLEDLHRGISLVMRLDDRPGRVGAACFLDHFVHGQQVLVILLVMPPVVPGHFPRRHRVLLQFPEALLLRGLADVQEELHHHRAVVHQLALERVDLLVRALPDLFAHELVHALHHHPAVPAPVEDRKAPARRRAGPESPQEGAEAFVFVWRIRGVDVEAARVHREKQAVDHRALARGVPAFEDDDDGDAERACLALQDPHLRLQRADRGLVFGLGELPRKIDVLKHGGTP